MGSAEKAGKTLQGIGVSPGIRIGEISRIESEAPQTPMRKIGSREVETEVLRFARAVTAAESQLGTIKAGIDRERASKHYYIIEAHQLMLRDEMLDNETSRLIRDHSVNAEWALKIATERLAARFEKLEDETFRGRSSDVAEVSRRILEQLNGHRPTALGGIAEDSIIAARNITPGEATHFYHHPVEGFILETGGKTSHIAIIARSMEIPAVLGVEGLLKHIEDGDRVILDGYEGLVIVNPSARQLEDYRDREKRSDMIRTRLLAYKDKPAIMLDGALIDLKANIESIEEIPSLSAHGAQGVGLFRTEFMYLDRLSPPDEEEHYETYRRLVEGCRGGAVTIRTVDIGGDKLPPYWEQQENANPALGVRAIRTIFEHEEFFVNQVRAILRASAHGETRLLLPFISGVSEQDRLLGMIDHMKLDLKREGRDFDESMPIGIMIELPSAVIVSDMLAQRADFFSIGTNDLIQYSLAVDRDAEQLSYLYNPLHPAILRMIRTTCDNAEKQEIPVALCGEMASEPAFTLLLIGLGLGELAMPPSAIPYIKHIIRTSTHEEARKLAQKALDCRTHVEVEGVVYPEMRRRYPEFFTGEF